MFRFPNIRFFPNTIACSSNYNVVKNSKKEEKEILIIQLDNLDSWKYKKRGEKSESEKFALKTLLIFFNSRFILFLWNEIMLARKYVIIFSALIESRTLTSFFSAFDNEIAVDYARLRDFPFLFKLDIWFRTHTIEWSQIMSTTSGSVADTSFQIYIFVSFNFVFLENFGKAVSFSSYFRVVRHEIHPISLIIK